MQRLLFGLLLTSYAAGAEVVLTNKMEQLDSNALAGVVRKMATSVEISQEKIAKIMSSIFDELKALRIDLNTAKSNDSSGWNCSSPFVRRGYLCLFAVCSAASWSEARKTCASKGGDLIWLKNSVAHSRADDFFTKSCAVASLYWTSLHRTRNGEFQWGSRKENEYTDARILNTSHPNFASVPLTKTLRGKPLRSKFPFVCRRAPTIGDEDFQAVELRDIDISALGVNLGRLNLTVCRSACASRGPACVAFHHSSDGMCFAIEKIPELWNLKAGVPAALYFVRSRNLTSSCSSAKFPLAHGASRYRFVKERKTWDEARANCEALGGKLAELPTARERELITADGKSIEEFPAYLSQAFIGMRQKAGSREPSEGWMWYHSGFPVTEGWYEDQPNNYYWGGEDVGALSFREGSLFDEHKEKYTLSSICECSIIM